MNPTSSRSHRPVGGARLLRNAAGCIFVAMLVAGCAQGDDGAPSTSLEPADAPAAGSAEPVPAYADSPCELLDATAVEELIGGAPEGREAEVPGTSLLACHYGDITEQGLRIVRVPAGDWAHSLPAVVATLRGMPEGVVDPGILKQIEQAADLLEKGAEIPAVEACEYFSLLLEAHGEPAGTTNSVSYLPDLESAIAISGQQCVDGRYSSLLVGRPDAGEVPGLAQKVAEVLGRLG